MSRRIQIPEFPELQQPTSFEKAIQGMVLAFFFILGVLILLAALIGVIALGQAVFH